MCEWLVNFRLLASLIVTYVLYNVCLPEMSVTIHLHKVLRCGSLDPAKACPPNFYIFPSRISLLVCHS